MIWGKYVDLLELGKIKHSGRQRIIHGLWLWKKPMAVGSPDALVEKTVKIYLKSFKTWALRIYRTRWMENRAKFEPGHKEKEKCSGRRECLEAIQKSLLLPGRKMTSFKVILTKSGLYICTLLSQARLCWCCISGRQSDFCALHFIQLKNSNWKRKTADNHYGLSTF